MTIATKPIIFSAPMVRAILDGRKTQTRRIIKPQPTRMDGNVPYGDGPKWAHAASGSAIMRCPYGKAGDQLWVRETFGIGYDNGNGGYSALQPTRSNAQTDGKVFYKADFERDGDTTLRPWRPSIYMPRWASRLTLKNSRIWVERLQEISEADALAEGIYRVENIYGNGPAYCDYLAANQEDMAEWFASPIDSYKSLWESINGRGSWDTNPLVWCVEFRRI